VTDTVRAARQYLASDRYDRRAGDQRQNSLATRHLDRHYRAARLKHAATRRLRLIKD
jgi:hypothetical protein